MHGAHGNLPYALEISRADRMVFLVEWDAGGNVEIILFRRGDWESKLLDAGWGQWRSTPADEWQRPRWITRRSPLARIPDSAQNGPLSASIGGFDGSVAQILDSNGLAYYINVGQIAYMVRGPTDHSTSIVFSGDKDHKISIQQPPGVIMQEATRPPLTRLFSTRLQ
jgi:hypothetical protein